MPSPYVARGQARGGDGADHSSDERSEGDGDPLDAEGEGGDRQPDNREHRTDPPSRCDTEPSPPPDP